MTRDNITCYGIYIPDHFDNKTDIFLEMKNIFQTMKRVKNSKDDFCDIHFIIGISNTDSDSATVSYEKTGKRGRPKRVITGKKVEWHFHVYVTNTIKTPSTFCNKVKSRLNKKYQNIRLGRHNNPQYAFDYTKKQSENCWEY